MMKRALDLVVAAVGLLLLWPLFLLIALLIKLDSRGPALFRQQRIGRFLRPFIFLKFRTLVENAADQVPRATPRCSATSSYSRPRRSTPCTRSAVWTGCSRPWPPITPRWRPWSRRP